MHAPRSDSRPIIGTDVTTLTEQGCAEVILGWAAAGESRVVVCANTHVLTMAARSAPYRAAIDCADMVTPDGMPLAWCLRRMGSPGHDRVYGPDLMLTVCRRAAEQGLSVFLYGSTEATLAALVSGLKARVPELVVAGTLSPPFRELTQAEVEAHAERVARSGASILFVGLGAPKQELWMARQRGRVPMPMLGVGAAFDFHAGTLAQAPSWMQDRGLEWLYRVAHEPRRLWRRYLVGNTLFVVLAARQAAGAWLARGRTTV